MTPLKAKPALLGVDVGFSLTGKTTGLAWRVNGMIGARVTGTAWASRSAALPADVIFDIAALDAPLVPAGDGKPPRRSCEAAFYRGSFWNRCRPGMSHHGYGLNLRNAGSTAAGQFSKVLRSGGAILGGITPTVPMVEAFPNAFLGVLLPDDTFNGAGKFVKGQGQARSDWLYEAAVRSGIFNRLLDDLGWHEPETAQRVVQEHNHDLRAALVCLLTAGFAAADTATVVGDEKGGWFCLPPIRLWAGWAIKALGATVKQACLQGYSRLTVVHGSSEDAKPTTNDVLRGSAYDRMTEPGIFIVDGKVICDGEAAVYSVEPMTVWPRVKPTKGTNTANRWAGKSRDIRMMKGTSVTTTNLTTKDQKEANAEGTAISQQAREEAIERDADEDGSAARTKT